MSSGVIQPRPESQMRSLHWHRAEKCSHNKSLPNLTAQQYSLQGRGRCIPSWAARPVESIQMLVTAPAKQHSRCPFESVRSSSVLEKEPTLSVHHLDAFTEGVKLLDDSGAPFHDTHILNHLQDSHQVFQLFIAVRKVDGRLDHGCRPVFYSRNQVEGVLQYAVGICGLFDGPTKNAIRCNSRFGNQ